MNADSRALRTLQDRAAIIDVVTRFAVSLDHRDWPALRSCLDQTVEVDYPDSVGIATVGAEDLVATATRFFGRLDATQHVSANHQVELTGPDRATCTSTLLAQHHLAGCDGGELQRQVGYYTNFLVRREDGWCIARTEQRVFWSDGNPAVYAHAAAAFAGEPAK